MLVTSGIAFITRESFGETLYYRGTLGGPRPSILRLDSVSQKESAGLLRKRGSAVTERDRDRERGPSCGCAFTYARICFIVSRLSPRKSDVTPRIYVVSPLKRSPPPPPPPLVHNPNDSRQPRSVKSGD